MSALRAALENQAVLKARPVFSTSIIANSVALSAIYGKTVGGWVECSETHRSGREQVEPLRRQDAKGTEKNRVSGFNFAPPRLCGSTSLTPLARSAGEGFLDQNARQPWPRMQDSRATVTVLWTLSGA